MEADGGRPTTDNRRTAANNRPPSTPLDGRRSAVGRQWSLLVLIGGTFAVALLFASPPFLTGSTQATGWLMFSAWAIGVGAALAIQVLWHSGRLGR